MANAVLPREINIFNDATLLPEVKLHDGIFVVRVIGPGAPIPTNPHPTLLLLLGLTGKAKL